MPFRRNYTHVIQAPLSDPNAICHAGSNDWKYSSGWKKVFMQSALINRQARHNRRISFVICSLTRGWRVVSSGGGRREDKLGASCFAVGFPEEAVVVALIPKSCSKSQWVCRESWNFIGATYMCVYFQFQEDTWEWWLSILFLTFPPRAWRVSLIFSPSVCSWKSTLILIFPRGFSIILFHPRVSLFTSVLFHQQAPTGLNHSLFGL